ncbi:hypothetical protein [Streptomyces anulatus]|uniref:hypothetical protein n=1 Tax=Streptomyces anulatus TaxID=1892 RepID=UPI00342DA821
MSDNENWRTHWMTYEGTGTDRGIVQDVCNGIRMVAETGAGDPVETVALAVAGAEAAEALTQALAGEWALYTPGQITVTASAVFGQLEGVLSNLHAIRATLDRMEARRETAFTDAACDRLRHVAELEELPQLVELPADAHELLASVADLLGPDAEFRAFHEPNAYEEDDSGFGCGCEVLITHDGEVWNLHRGDSTWSMVRESEGKQQPDGSTTFSSWIDLDPTPTTSHPHHLRAVPYL